MANALGIRVHRAIRRATSRGGCDLCGEPIDAEVHAGEGEVLAVQNEVELEQVFSKLLPRHRDQSLCTREDCKRPHVGDDERDDA